MPPALFDDLFLYFRDSPAIKSMIGGRTQSVYRQSSSRCQLIYRITHGLAKVVQFLSIHSPFKGSTDVSTGQPDIDVIRFVGQRVLVTCEPGTPHHREGNLPVSWREGR